MRRKNRFRLCFALLCCLVSLAFPAPGALAETPGFGMVNAGDVALRRDVRGQKITRLQKGTSVWITESKADSRGEMWYHVRAQETAKSGFPVRSGWIKAEFVDAGSGLWNNIRTVKTASLGMIALKNDGTVLLAGDFMLCDPRDRYTGLKDIRQVGFSTVGCGFFAVDGRGRLYRDGVRAADGIRLAGSHDLVCVTEDNRLLVTYNGDTQLRWIYPQNGGEADPARVTAMAECNYRNLFLTEDGKVFCAYVDDAELGYPEPDWASWTDAESIDAELTSFGTYVIGGRTRRKYVPAFAAVRRDGTVLAAPESLAALTADWRDMRKVAVGSDWILGLKRDGTVTAAGIGGRTPPDLSGWTDITDISNGHTYCVGVKRDGTLVFAGDYTFSAD
jgi:hypothetical protein